MILFCVANVVDQYLHCNMNTEEDDRKIAAAAEEEDDSDVEIEGKFSYMI